MHPKYPRNNLVLVEDKLMGFNKIIEDFKVGT